MMQWLRIWVCVFPLAAVSKVLICLGFGLICEKEIIPTS